MSHCAISINHRDRMAPFSQNLSHRNNARKQLLTSLIDTARDFNDTRRFASKESGEIIFLHFPRRLTERASLRLNRRGPLGIIASPANILLYSRSGFVIITNTLASSLTCVMGV